MLAGSLVANQNPIYINIKILPILVISYSVNLRKTLTDPQKSVVHWVWNFAKGGYDSDNSTVFVTKKDSLGR